ncbi:LCP family protein [Streptomyces sp. AK02-01A]|uniref:LCP family protein n=1 Tax=Streptomyces sp. AK02-01A TaxID=3028648 RepID=UPI0029B0AD9C|nr:LCP family protein [Streptomyces sp. AK02-01A]MDX3854793.1 LCP family protein [Streptomyces sp. AK02-01A]
MDADVTDSAGTPAEPETPAANEPAAGTPEPDDDAPARETARAGADTPPSERTTREEATDGPAVAEAAPDTDSGNATATAPDADPGSATATAGKNVPSGLNRKSHWLRWTALGTSVVVLAAAAAGWWVYEKLDGNITTDTTAAAELRTYEKDRPTPVVLNAQNILLLGSDTRSGEGNGKYGRDDGGSQRSDTTILLHLAADRQSATAVSVPRDLMVDIPSCRKPDGTRTEARFAQFNWAFEFGGAACTIRTIEKLTGIRVDHHMVIDFSGFKDVVDAVDGVQVCLKEPVDDKEAQLKLPAGTPTLNGEQALGFVRARHGIGDGSDTQRMDRQQRFLGALFKKVQSNGVLLNPTRLYPVLDAATKALTTDPGLNSLQDLYDLARSMQSVPTEKVQFLTAPREPYSADPNRDQLQQPDAGNLFKQLRDDEPVSVSPSGKSGDSGDSAKSENSRKSSEDTTGGTSTDDGGSGEENSSSTDEKSGDSAPGNTGRVPTFSGSNAAQGLCD